MPDSKPPESERAADQSAVPVRADPEPASESVTPQREIGGRSSGLDPTRYGDWEKNGRCIDF